MFRIAGNLREGGIDRDDQIVRVGNQYRLAAGIENLARQLESRALVGRRREFVRNEDVTGVLASLDRIREDLRLEQGSVLAAMFPDTFGDVAAPFAFVRPVHGPEIVERELAEFVEAVAVGGFGGEVRIDDSPAIARTQQGRQRAVLEDPAVVAGGGIVRARHRLAISNDQNFPAVLWPRKAPQIALLELQARQRIADQGRPLAAQGGLRRGIRCTDAPELVHHQHGLLDRGRQPRPDIVSRRCFDEGLGQSPEVRAEDQRVHAGPNPCSRQATQPATFAIRHPEQQRASRCAFHEQRGAGREEGRLAGEEFCERSADELRITPLQQFAGGAVHLQDRLVAGDDQPLFDELEEGQVEPRLGTVGEVRNEGLRRFGGRATEGREVHSAGS